MIRRARIAALLVACCATGCAGPGEQTQEPSTVAAAPTDPSTVTTETTETTASTTALPEAPAATEARS